MRWRWVVLALLFAAYSQSVQCAPQQGLGLALGLTHHTYHLPQAQGAPLEFNSSGLGLFGDAQFVYQGTWTLNPALHGSIERSTDMFHVEEPSRGWVLSFGMLAQVRRWWSDVFLGVQAGLYAQYFRTFRDQVFLYESPGAGILMGWEEASGRTLVFALEQENALVPGQRQLIRLQIGWRWG